MYDNLPQYLKDNALFCLWKYETRNGKTTKVPYRIDGYRADSTEASDFVCFSEAISAFQKGKYDGIGIMVHGHISAIDIDNCVINGELTNMAKDVVNTVDSYTEYSPSGTGIRVITLTGDMAYDKTRYFVNNRKIGMEIYVAGCTAKFVTLTGNTIRAGDFTDRTDKVKAVMDKYMLRPVKESRKTALPTESYLSDKSVISTASTAINGNKFKKLWNGDISDYPSNSEADIALCSILAFYCGGDTEQMDRLFRESGLMRDKWERDDYRMATLEKAVSVTSEFYTPYISLEKGFVSVERTNGL